MKISLGLIYGGKSAEHNVSLQTALAVTKALNTEKFDIHPIYITEEGEWLRGENSLNQYQTSKCFNLNRTQRRFYQLL